MKVAKEKKVVKKAVDHAESLYTALKMLLSATSNREAHVAVSVAQQAIASFEGKPTD